MSIVIDMDMPKYCNECHFCTDSCGECNLEYEHIPNYEFWSDKNEKPEWCPLKSVDEKSKQIPKDDVLDKIRSEIEQEYIKSYNGSLIWSERACGLGTALEIIDKYKAESEG